MGKEEETIKQCLVQCAEWKDEYPNSVASYLIHGMKFTLMIADIDPTQVDTLHNKYKKEWGII